MDQLPHYSSLISPPTYESSVEAAQQEESIWPHNYGRQTPRINVAKFYHDLVLNSPHQYDTDDDEENELTKYSCRSVTEEEELPPSPPSSPALSSYSSSSIASPISPVTSSSSRTMLSSVSTSSISSLLDHPHHHTITELNRLLLQTWANADTAVPSYEAFKAKVNSHDLRPIPNTFH
ncbi:unnamed protein product [Absidia cylindrospora]